MSNSVVIAKTKLYDFSVSLISDSVLFNEDGWAELDIEVSVTCEDGLELYSADEKQTKVGVKVYVADNNGDILEPKELIGEFRAEGKKQNLKNGEKTIIRLPVFIDTKSNKNHVLEIDLVKEHSYWFSDAGLTMPNIVCVKKQLYISSENIVQNNSVDSLLDKLRDQQISDYQKREERSEIIIFSLLNSLKKLSAQEK